MSDLFDAPGPGAPRASIGDGVSWDAFWAAVARTARHGTGSEGRVSVGVDRWGDLEAEWAPLPAAREGVEDLVSRKPPADGDDEEDEDEDDDDEDDEDLDEDEDLDDLDEDDLDDEDEDDDDFDEDEDLDELDEDDLEDDDEDEFDDDLVDLDDQYDNEDEERHRGGGDYEPD